MIPAELFIEPRWQALEFLFSKLWNQLFAKLLIALLAELLHEHFAKLLASSMAELLIELSCTNPLAELLIELFGRALELLFAKL